MCRGLSLYVLFYQDLIDFCSGKVGNTTSDFVSNGTELALSLAPGRHRSMILDCL